MGHNIRKYQKQKKTDETNQVKVQGQEKNSVLNTEFSEFDLQQS